MPPKLQPISHLTDGVCTKLNTCRGAIPASRRSEMGHRRGARANPQDRPLRSTPFRACALRVSVPSGAPQLAKAAGSLATERIAICSRTMCRSPAHAATSRSIKCRASRSRKISVNRSFNLARVWPSRLLRRSSGIAETAARAAVALQPISVASCPPARGGMTELNEAPGQGALRPRDRPRIREAHPGHAFGGQPPHPVTNEGGTKLQNAARDAFRNERTNDDSAIA